MLASAFAPRSHRRQGGDALQWLPKRAALASDPVLPVCSMRSTGKTAGCPCAAACDHHGLTLTTIARLMTAKTYQRADSGLPLPISRWTASMTTISPHPQQDRRLRQRGQVLRAFGARRDGIGRPAGHRAGRRRT